MPSRAQAQQGEHTASPCGGMACATGRPEQDAATIGRLPTYLTGACCRRLPSISGLSLGFLRF